MALKVKAKKALKKPSAKVKAPVQRAGRTSTSRISSKNQLTVPVDIMRKVGLAAGDEVEFVVNDAGFIQLQVEGQVNPVLNLVGKYGDLFTGFDLEAERDSWER